MSRKVIHLARLFAPHIGGVEKHVGELVKLHREKGDEVIVVTEQYKSALPLEEIESDYEVLRIPKEVLDGKLGIWRWMWQRRKLFIDADIIQAHDVFWWLLPLYLFIVGKVHTTFHGWETEFPIPISNKLQRWLYALLSRKTIHVGDWIKEFYWDKPDLVTYGGTRVFDPVAQKKFKDLEELEFTFLGRLEPDTAVPQYLDLLEHLSEALPSKEINVTWVGEGSMHLQCEKWGKVTGYVPNPAPYLANTDFVFASSYLSMLEAQALGKIVISLYDHQLKKRYLQTYPGKKHLILAKSPAAAVMKLKKLLKDTEKLISMSNKAQEFAQEQTWEKVFNLYEKEIWN